MIKRKIIGIDLMDEEGAPLKKGDMVLIIAAGKEFLAQVEYNKEEHEYMLVSKFSRQKRRYPWQEIKRRPRMFFVSCMDRLGWFGRHGRMLKGVFLITRGTEVVDV